MSPGTKHIFNLLKAIEGRRGEMLALIERLVLQNSFTENPAGGTVVGEMLAEAFCSVPGLSGQAFESSSKRFAPHWVFTTPAAGDNSKGCIALVGHLDTVFPPGSFEGFHIEGNIARGPGVLDMKGGLVVMLEALRVLSQFNLIDKIPIRIVIVSDEEVGSPEGRPLIQEHLKDAACALVFEAGRKNDLVITARKGTAGLKAAAIGKAAHAGNAHKEGANAIWALAKFIDCAQQLTDYGRGITVNVGKVSGGQSKNTVPDAAEAHLDFRFEHQRDGEATLLALQQAAERAMAAVPGTSVVVGGSLGRAPLEKTPENTALYQAYAACAKEAGLGYGEAPLVGGGSDASSTAAIGIPSIDGLGPRGTGFHTKDELIEIDSLVPKAAALALFLTNFNPIQTNLK